MAKELLCLGKMQGGILIALADICDITPRTVPVKKISYEEYEKLQQDGVILNESPAALNKSITKATYVKVGSLFLEKKKSIYILSEDITVDVFISGAGKLRVLHPVFIRETRKYVKYYMKSVARKYSIKDVTIKKISNVESLLEEFYEYVADEVSIAYMLQMFLMYGVYGQLEVNSRNNTCDVKLLSLTIQDTMDIGTVKIARNCRVLDVYATYFAVDDFYVNSRVLIYAQIPKDDELIRDFSYKIKVLHAGSCTDFNSCFFSFYVDKIVGTYNEMAGSVQSGKLGNLEGYTSELLKEAGIVYLCDCFKEKLVEIQEDVVLDKGIYLEDCFWYMKFKGNLVVQDEVMLHNCFHSVELQNVLLKNVAAVEDSFDNDTVILGDLNLQALQVKNSFNCVVQGKSVVDVLQISDESFCGCINALVIDAKDKNFSARLQNSDMTLTVRGCKGDFIGINIKELIWDSLGRSILSTHMFKCAHMLMSNQVDSIKKICTEAFYQYKGEVLDLRQFSNVEEIEPRAVKDCDNLSVVLLDSSIELKASTFKNCPQLAHVYIGDAIKAISASAFDAVAPVVHIYYKNNQVVQKLCKIPRFKLHSNNSIEDVIGRLKVRKESVEQAAVVATFSEVTVNRSTVNDDELYKLLCAEELTLQEIGMCEGLEEKYPIKESCERDLTDLSWVANAHAREVVLAEREDLVRLYVGCVTRLYPYCTDIFDVNFDVIGEIILRSSEYDFVRGCKVRAYGQYSVYAIVDRRKNKIIHTYCLGLWDDTREVAKYFSLMSKDLKPCAVMRYADRVQLLGYPKEYYPKETLQRLQDSINVTWLPIGYFKVANRDCIVGIDTFTGDVFMFPCKARYKLKHSEYYFKNYPTLQNWARNKIDDVGRFYTDTLDMLKPIYANTNVKLLL